MATEEIRLPNDIEAENDAVRANPQVLIADPDVERRLAYTVILEDAGYRVMGIADMASALAETAISQPDLIIVQLVEPPTEGLDLCRQVRSGADTRDTPVIVLTRQDDAYIREQVVRSGGTAILTEPLKRTLLLRQVRRLLSRSRPRAS